MGASIPPRARAMLAGDVAKKLGVGVQTLHYYEREGLIPPPERTESGYRLYTPELVDRVAFIRKAQALGLSLAEIGEILSLAELGASPCGRVQRALAEKLVEVDRRLAELQAFRTELASLVAHGEEMSRRSRAVRVCAIVEQAPRLVSRELANLSLTPKRGRLRRSPSLSNQANG
jgi:DNA-binding transcriptional MerR regulator